MLAEDAALADAALEDLRLDLLRGRRPLRLEARVTAHLRELRGAVERDPAHQLRRDVVLRRATGLPDALVGVLPDLGRAFGLRLHDRPEAARESLALPRVEEDRVEDGAEDVVLPLVERAVPDADGTGPGVPREVVERRLGQVAPPVDPVHDLQRPVVVRLEVGDELHELVGLPVEVEPVERLERERRVAHPRVAVVPVALAAWRLGQRRRQRRHGGAGRHVGQPLDRERRALDRVAPAVIGDPRAPEPAAPEAPCRGDPRVRLVGILRRREPFGPGEAAVRALALLEHVAAADAVALDPEQEIGAEADRHAGTASRRPACRSSPTSVHSAGVRP